MNASANLQERRCTAIRAARTILQRAELIMLLFNNPVLHSPGGGAHANSSGI